jgi:hypothetical protein
VLKRIISASDDHRSRIADRVTAAELLQAREVLRRLVEAFKRLPV